jgi:hypothetical protein
MGLEPDNPPARLACKALLEGGFRSNGGISFAKTVDCIDHGVTGLVLSLLAYFGYPDDRVHAIVEYLLGEQAPDGHWQPVTGRPNMAASYSFDATLLVLEGLHEYGQRYPNQVQGITAAQKDGRQFLLRHRLYKAIQAETVIDPKMLRFSFPPRWHYDILAALDYFRECRAEKDERLRDAIDVVKAKCNPNGRWNLNHRHPGKTYFEMEEAGKPSKWITLRALRFLKWFDR